VRLAGLLPILALAAFLAPAPSDAQYPARPIRLVVPFTAGGVTDSVARITANQLSKSLGQPVVVENRPGADGAIAAQTVKAAAPDGYTLLFATNSVLAIPLLSKSAGFDAFADFMPVSTVGRFPFALFVHPEVPSKSVKDLVDYARANPGKLNYATVNPGEQLITGQFIKATGVDMVRVPYKGGAAALPDLVAGRIHVYFTPVGNGLAHAKEGRVRMLATLLPERTPLAPEVPTMAEAGHRQHRGDELPADPRARRHATRRGRASLDRGQRRGARCGGACAARERVPGGRGHDATADRGDDRGGESHVGAVLPRGRDHGAMRLPENA
jgi:tripartite-type tricarboxylate transporter receptor subunit TctC